MKTNFDSLELIAENKSGVARYDRENKIYYAQWYGTFNLLNTIEVLDQVKAFSKKNLMIGTCQDTTKLIGTFTKLNSYLEKDHIPELQKNGIKYISFAMSNDPFTRFAVNAFIKLVIPKGLEVKIFGDIDCLS